MVEATMKKKNETKNEKVKQDQKDTKQVYINSYNASDIKANMKWGRKLKNEYLGCIPYSLELIKLRQQKDFNVKIMKSTGKEKSDDIINVKFESGLWNGEKALNNCNENIKRIKFERDELEKQYEQNELMVQSLEDKKEINKIKKEQETIEEKLYGKKRKNGERVDSYLTTQLNYYEEMKRKINKNDVEIKPTDLRKDLYEHGFQINNTKYVHYKRSAAKSRQGQCLFIKKSLKEPMIHWSRMNLPFEIGQDIDLARLLTSECLVSTSIEKTIKINPEHILLVSDIEKPIKEIVADVVKMDKQGNLKVKNELTDIDNCLTDGEALLNADKFEKGQSMMLLRQHMFKAAAFATNIQLFLSDYAEEHNINFDTWEIKNMFNESIKAKEIEMVVTPSCCKFLKFSDIKGSDKAMWNYWIDLVGQKEKEKFGVCKHEKSSKFGKNEQGEILQQTSYQMINSLKADKGEIGDLAQYELDYIERLKNDTDAFIEYLRATKNDVNANEMMMNIYEKNHDFAHTELFKKYRTKQIHNYVENARKGKIKLNGDYCVLFGNPLSYLYKMVNAEPEHELKGNESWTSLFENNDELIAFRNPHTSPSNIVVMKNTYLKEINTYFELEPNVMCVNAIDFPIQRRLSGCDYDSDSAVIFKNETLLEIAIRTFENKNYPVCVNGITDGETKQYKLCINDAYTIDDTLANSQKIIGKVVNAGQLVMSKYWNGGLNVNQVKKLTDDISIATVLSEVAIDLAKKYYKIDFDCEIRKLKNDAKFSNKIIDEKGKEKEKQYFPKFWQYRGKSTSKKNKYELVKTPMDYLESILDEIEYAQRIKKIPLSQILIDGTVRHSNNTQIQEFAKIMADTNKKIQKLKDQKQNDEDKDKENDEAQMRIFNQAIKEIGRRKMTNETILNMLKIAGDKKKKGAKTIDIIVGTAVLNAVYKNHKTMFMDCIKENIE